MAAICGRMSLIAHGTCAYGSACCRPRWRPRCETRAWPVEAGALLAAAQRQAFADGRLVDLDNADAGRFQVGDFLADGQRDPQRGAGARLVVAHERLLQDADRARQHAFHRFIGQALRITVQATVMAAGRCTSP